MSRSGCLVIRRTRDWANLSKVVIRTGNQDLMNLLLLKTAKMSNNGFAKIIYDFGHNGEELRIFTQLGKAVDVVYELLDGQDYNWLNADATVETIN